MSKSKPKFVQPARRSIPAISLQNFRSARFRHKTEARGGSVNTMAEDLLEVDNLDGLDDEDSEW